MNRRVLQLDVLRSVAILLVIGRHFEMTRPGGLVGFVAEAWFRVGWLGVDLFFVLSGFLIGGLLISEHKKHGQIHVGRFLVRRGLKIYPPYFVFIGYLVLMPTMKALVGGKDGWAVLSKNWLEYWPNLIFLQNYVGTNPAGHTWSLAVEEHFYLLLPFALIATIAAQKMNWISPVCLVGIPLFVLSVRCASVWFGDPYAIKMAATHLRLDALLFGVGIRATSEYYPGQFAAISAFRLPLSLAGILLWLPIYLVSPNTPFIRTVGLTCTLLGAAAFLICAYHTHARDFGSFSRWVSPTAYFFGWIGVYSYAIYLWHVTAIGVLNRVVVRRLQALVSSDQLGWVISALVVTAGVILVGIVASRVVEWPVIRIRDRFFPSRSGSFEVVSPMIETEPQREGTRLEVQAVG